MRYQFSLESLESCSQFVAEPSRTPRLTSWHFHIIAEEFLSFCEANATWRLHRPKAGSDLPHCWSQPRKYPTKQPETLSTTILLDILVKLGDLLIWQEMFWRFVKGPSTLWMLMSLVGNILQRSWEHVQSSFCGSCYLPVGWNPRPTFKFTTAWHLLSESAPVPNWRH